jgi:molybdopterin molybdotransferase
MPDGSYAAGCDALPDLIAPEVALERLLAGTAAVPGTLAVPLAAAAGRVLAAPVHAPGDLPPFDQAAMDGYGFTASDCVLGAMADAGPRLARRIAAGAAAGPPVLPGDAVRILTGAAVPQGIVAVLMEEHARLRDGRVQARRSLEPGLNIRRRGEDVAAGQAMLEAGTRLAARHVALLAALGVAQVPVRALPRVGLLSNGTELDGRHGLWDSNRPMLAAVLAGQPATVVDLGLLPDDPAQLADALARAAPDLDLILTTGGVSGSDADHLPASLVRAGGECAVLKLAQKPGKPLAHGWLGPARCLFLPGNPMAALVGMLTLGLPLLRRLAGMPGTPPPLHLAVLASGFRRAPGRVEFLPVRRVGEAPDGRALVERTGPAGSARLLPLAQADALLRVPAAMAAVAAGSVLPVLPLDGMA